MQKENLLQLNNKRYEANYKTLLKKYSRMTNIGYYAKIGMEITDLIHDAFLSFIKYFPPETTELEDAHVANLMNLYVYRQKQLSMRPVTREFKESSTVTFDAIFHDSTYFPDGYNEVEEKLLKFDTLSRYYKGYKRVEIAKQLGVSPTQVKNLRDKEFKQLLSQNQGMLNKFETAKYTKDVQY
jgi:hypothetical protein